MTGIKATRTACPACDSSDTSSYVSGDYGRDMHGIHMQEPFLSQFRSLISQGAAVQDVHDIPTHTGYAVTHTCSSQAFVDRELHRVEVHQRSLIPLLEHFVERAPLILDVGCGTGGTTVAVALSRGLQASQVIGVDPNRLSIEAARIRSQGHHLGPDRLLFKEITPGKSLPFADNRFHLTVCVSVLEFISTHESRAFLASEMVRVTKPGGFIFLATPNPFRLRDYHTRRWLGELRRREGYPWSSVPWTIKLMFAKCQRLSLNRYLVSQMGKRLGLRRAKWPLLLTLMVVWGFPWQKFLFLKRA